MAGFPDMNSAILFGEGAWVLAVTGKSCCSPRGALAFPLSIASWLQCSSLSPGAPILRPTGSDFPSSTPGLSAFLGQILDMNLQETPPWALGLQLDLCGHCCGMLALSWIPQVSRPGTGSPGSCFLDREGHAAKSQIGAFPRQDGWSKAALSPAPDNEPRALCLGTLMLVSTEPSQGLSI
ncbi:hypothetical protein H920_12943 [Fukomys damarensis]|uniref:Uncharacterized protein n=1 Tax=Fukomys damarensis TaxID=885580 RepID=A0A091D0P6_FUKDA|nr:hypothetical protein H920_12943 [Fukomys damarensis]